MKKGFTLIELSIVLVIIGLLIGGILVARSMIDTVRAQKTITNLQQYEIATNNFKMRFKKYPGDSPLFVPPGNGDDTLVWGAAGDSMFCSDVYPNYSNIERSQVFTHLSQSKMISAEYRPYDPIADCGGTIDNIYAGITTAYTELSSAQAVALYGQKIAPIENFKYDGLDNFSFQLVLNAKDVLVLQRKLGYTQGNSPNIVGLDEGGCSDINGPISCGNSGAVLGYISYYLAQ